MKSSSRRLAQTPAATPSSPMYMWTKPGTSPVRNSRATRSSNERIVAIVRYSETMVSRAVSAGMEERRESAAELLERAEELGRRNSVDDAVVVREAGMG